MFLVALLSGLPVFLSFLIVNLISLFVIGGVNALILVPGSVVSSLATFKLVAIIFFVLMGETFLHAGLAKVFMDGIDKVLYRIPARLSGVAVVSGVIFGSMSGSSIATTAMLGSILVPDMKRRGYSTLLSCGPVLGSGGLAMIIPPSALAVILAAVAGISVAKILIAGIIPGLLMGTLYFSYIMIAVKINPSLAPVIPPEQLSFSDRIRALLPVTTFIFIVFLVVGLILLGVATPSEAAALGALGTVILVALFKRLSKDVVMKSLKGTVEITGSVFAIIGFAATFSQVLSLSGASRGLALWISTLPLSPPIVVALMLFTIILMGAFMETNSIIMITMPIFMPLVFMWDLNPVWFGILVLICLEVGQTTPPFGLLVYVLRGIVSIPIKDLYVSAAPFLVCDVIVICVIFFFPQIAIWLTSFL